MGSWFEGGRAGLDPDALARRSADATHPAGVSVATSTLTLTPWDEPGEAADRSLEEHEQIVAPVDSGNEQGGARFQRRRKGAVIRHQLVVLRVGGRIIGEAGRRTPVGRG